LVERRENIDALEMNVRHEKEKRVSKEGRKYIYYTFEKPAKCRTLRKGGNSFSSRYNVLICS